MELRRSCERWWPFTAAARKVLRPAAPQITALRLNGSSHVVLRSVGMRPAACHREVFATCHLDLIAGVEATSHLDRIGAADSKQRHCHHAHDTCCDRPHMVSCSKGLMERQKPPLAIGGSQQLKYRRLEIPVGSRLFVSGIAHITRFVAARKCFCAAFAASYRLPKGGSRTPLRSMLS